MKKQSNLLEAVNRLKQPIDTSRILDIIEKMSIETVSGDEIQFIDEHDGDCKYDFKGSFEMFYYNKVTRGKITTLTMNFECSYFAGVKTDGHQDEYKNDYLRPCGYVELITCSPIVYTLNNDTTWTRNPSAAIQQGIQNLLYHQIFQSR